MSNYAVMSLVIPMGDGLPEDADRITDEIEQAISGATDGMFFFSDVGFMVVPVGGMNIPAGANEVLRGIATNIHAAMAHANTAPIIEDAVLVRADEHNTEWDLTQRKANGEDITQA
tara:strand:+ start:4125 stop:4472 length:348 start_codon:yes stop_codon:yes gene_type:complete